MVGMAFIKILHTHKYWLLNLIVQVRKHASNFYVSLCFKGIVRLQLAVKWLVYAENKHRKVSEEIMKYK